jgi:hypothetical protein
LKFGVGNSCLSIVAFSFIHTIYYTFVSINLLKFGVGILCLNIVAFSFIHMVYCTCVPSNYMSQTILVMTCNRSKHKHDKPLVSSVPHVWQMDMFSYHIFQHHGFPLKYHSWMWALIYIKVLEKVSWVIKWEGEIVVNLLPPNKWANKVGQWFFGIISTLHNQISSR